MRRRYALLSVALLYLGSACMQDPEAPNNQPDTPTLSVDETSVTRVSMLANGSFGHDLTDITSYGVELSTTLFESGGEVQTLTPQEVGPDGYALGISGLSPNETYYLRAFISNGHSKMYSSVITQKTPETSVASVSDVVLSADGAYVTATLEDNGGRSVEEVGFVWGSTNDRRSLRREKRYPATLSDDGKSFKLPVSYIGKGTHYVLAYAEDNKEATGFSRIAYEHVVDDGRQPANEIWYTSTDGEVVEPSSEYAEEWGATLLSNRYENGKGIISFNGPISAIATSAFRNCATLETVTLAGTSISAINWGGFLSCSNLKSISLPASLKILGGCALEGTAISSIELPSSLESIDHDAFASCPRLEEITIPESVTYISPTRVFGDRTPIKAFYGKGATADHACLIMDDCLVGIANKDQELDFVIPDGVKSLGTELFDYWCYYKSITFPSSLQLSSESMGFLSSPQRLTAFYGDFVSEDKRCLIINGEMLGFACYNLGSSSYTVPAGVRVMGKASMYNQNNYELKTLILPEGVESVKDSFIGLTSIESVELPSSLKEIDDKAFFAAYDLKRLTVPASVESIGSLAFQAAGYEARRLSARPSSLQIEPWADDANGMTDITFLSATPPAIQPDTFDQMVYDCPLYVPADAVDTYKSATNWSKYADRIMAAPEGEQPNNEIWYTSTDGNIVTPNHPEAFNSSIVSNTYENGIGVMVFEEPLTKIGTAAFWGCGFTSIQLPKALQEIEDEAFGACQYLETLDIPQSVTSISKYRVFSQCSNLSSFTGKFATEDHRSLVIDGVMVGFAQNGLTEYSIDSSVKEVGCVFESCFNLERINLPEGLTTIYVCAFEGCRALKRMDLPSSLRSIDEHAFRDCNGLTTMYIPQSVTSIKETAFDNCSSLQSFSGNFASEDGHCLVSNNNLLGIAIAGLEEYSIPEGITTSCHVMGFSGLKRIVFPETISTMGQVYQCNNLESIVVKAKTPPSAIIHYYPNYEADFIHLTNNCPIYVPAESVDTYKSAEYWSKYADRIQPIQAAIAPSKYLTFTSIGTSKISLNNVNGNKPTLYYSSDTNNWAIWDYSELVFSTDSPLYICGDNIQGFSDTTPDESYMHYSYFASSGDSYSVSGDIMSLISYSTDVLTIPSKGCFCYLFQSCKNMETGPELSATTLSDYCYYNMYYECRGLKQAPSLPATNLAIGCYESMFSYCSELTEAIELPAHSLAERCYSRMFYSCTKLKNAPELPATQMMSSCYSGMFISCSSIVTPPVLPATKLAERCYESMFSGCWGLLTAPALSATELAPNCYSSMFNDCTSLSSSPELPALLLAQACYNRMFRRCSSLHEPPELPAMELAPECYSYMFEDCAITYAPQLPATTMKKECYSHMFDETPLRIAPSLPATELAESCYSGMFRRCYKLQQAPSLPAMVLAERCYDNMFASCYELPTAPDLPATTLAPYCYSQMFTESLLLTSAPSILPATELSEGCYYNMFNLCENLTDAPALPAKVLTRNCYFKMFSGCHALKSIKCLANDLTTNSYSIDFWLNGVSSNGTFIKAADAEWPTGVSGIPEGWTVINDGDTPGGGNEGTGEEPWN